MNRNVITTVVAAVVAFAIGLGWSWVNGPQEGGVAVVDLDEVARQLGRDEQMDSVKETAGALSQSLSQIQQSLNKHLKERQAELGEQPTQEDVNEFAKLRQAAQLKFNQVAQQAEQQVQQRRLQLVSAFREEAKPIATKIAKEKGLTTIITRNDSVVFAFDEAVDITGEVVAQMKAEQRERPAPAAKPAQTPAPATTTTDAGQAEASAAPMPASQTAAPTATATK